jgi:hypothetical protein
MAAPPYDQISDERAAGFHGIDPHHFTWLTKPVEGESGDPLGGRFKVHCAICSSKVRCALRKLRTLR